MSDRILVEQFESRILHRSQINPAPYNPKIITKPAYTKLQEVMRHHRLIERPIWNERTGNLVGGHQRLLILDEACPDLDYSLPVAVVNKSPEEEIALNILLSNREAMGFDDADKLGFVIEKAGHKFTGYDEVDLGLLGIATKGIFTEDPAAALVSHVQEVLDTGKAVDNAYQHAKNAAEKDAAAELASVSAPAPDGSLPPPSGNTTTSDERPTQAEPHPSAFHPENTPAGASDIVNDTYARQLEVARQKQLEKDYREKADAKLQDEHNFFSCLVFTDPADQARFFKLFNLAPGADFLFGEGLLEQVSKLSLPPAKA